MKNEQPTVVENSAFIPALIEEDHFALVQQMKAGRRFKMRPKELPSPRAVASPYLVTGLAKCKCGHSLYARVQRKDGRLYEYYACMGKKNKGLVYCKAPNIPREALDKAVEREVLARYGDRIARQRFKEAVTATLDREKREVAAALAQVEQRITKLEAQERQVRLDYREQVITASEFRALRKDLLDELQTQRTRRQEYMATQAQLQEQTVALSAQLQAVDSLNHWGNLSPEQRKRLLPFFLQSLRVWMAADTGLKLAATWNG